MINIVYTYYNHVEKIENNVNKTYSQYDLIDICQKSWNLNGWNMVVLNHDIAKQHPLYNEYNDIIKNFPSINPEGYDYHCYMRWLAMAQIGGGLMIDYDVINNNLTPQAAEKIFDINQDKLTIYQRHVPSVVYGSEKQYADICKKFMSLNIEDCLDNRQQKRHTSDMVILSQSFFENFINKIMYVSSYPNINELIHCSERHCFENNVTKLEAMKNTYKEIVKQ